jgi:hypothetical protein
MSGGEDQSRPARRLTVGSVLLTVLTCIAAAIWFTPIYWAIVTSLRPDQATVTEFTLWPSSPTLGNYIFGIVNSKLPIWYLNSTITSVAITVVSVFISACTGYAISQLHFPGRRLLWWIILASFMIPVPALIVNHFVIIANVGLLNTHLGIILPMLLGPVTVIVYKGFFDGVPRIPRSGGDGRGDRIPALPARFPADELGRDDSDGDHHLHRGLEQLPVALSGGATRRDDDRDSRDHRRPGCLRGGLWAHPVGRGARQSAGGAGLSSVPAQGDAGNRAFGGDQGLAA